MRLQHTTFDVAVGLPASVIMMKISVSRTN